MSKKLLAVLVALSLAGAYACDDSSSDDSDSGACTNGALKCDANTPYTCVSGTWIKGTECTNGQTCNNGKCEGKAPAAECTEGAKDCNGQTPRTCTSGKWVDGTACTGATPKCVAGGCVGDDVVCAEGTTQCKADGKAVQKCTNNAWVDTETCTNGCEGGKCKKATDPSTPGGETTGTDPVVDTDCNKDSYPGVCSKDGKTGYYCNNSGKITAKACTGSKTCEVTGPNGVNCKDPNADPSVGTSCVEADYTPTCINDGANALVCRSNKIQQWDCKDKHCTVTGKDVDCPIDSGTTTDLPDCTATSSEKCKGACSSDKNTGYYWNNGLKTVDCKEKSDCSVNDKGYVACSSTTEAEKPANVPDTCTKGTSPAVCGSDGNAWFCGDKGYYLNATGTCSGSNKCMVCDNGYGGCTDKTKDEFCKTSGGDTTDLPDCTATSSAKCKGACSPDKKTGYYWNNALKTVDCKAKSDCTVSDKGYVACGSTSDLPDCTATSSAKCKGACSSDKNTGYYWNNALKTVDCKAKSDCSVSDTGYVACGSTSEKDCTNETKKTEGGVAGDCCDQAKYKPVCNGDTVNRCSSKGLVIIGQTCKGCKTEDDSTKPSGIKFNCD